MTPPRQKRGLLCLRNPKRVAYNPHPHPINEIYNPTIPKRFGQVNIPLKCDKQTKPKLFNIFCSTDGHTQPHKQITLNRHHSSLVSSAPTILRPRVCIPSTPSMPVSVCIIEIVMRKGQNKQKRGRVWPIFKKITLISRYG